MTECNANNFARVLDESKGGDLSKAWAAHNSCMEEIYGASHSESEATRLSNEFMISASKAEKKGTGIDLTIFDPNNKSSSVTYELVSEAQRKKSEIVNARRVEKK